MSAIITAAIGANPSSMSKGAQITVYKYLEKIRPSLKDVYVPIAYEPGIEAQVDFGEVWAYPQLVPKGSRQVSS